VRRPAAGKPRSGSGPRKNAWLAADLSKRWGEAFFLLYMPFWLTLVLGIIVPFKLYEVLAFKARAPHSIHLI
jgi:cycloeucalenol cycloisomerase